MNSCTADTHCDIIVITVNDRMECQATEKGTFWWYIREGKADCSLNDIWYVFRVISRKTRLDYRHCTRVQTKKKCFKCYQMLQWMETQCGIQAMCTLPYLKQGLSKMVKQHWALSIYPTLRKQLIEVNMNSQLTPFGFLKEL